MTRQPTGPDAGAGRPWPASLAAGAWSGALAGSPEAGVAGSNPAGGTPAGGTVWCLGTSL